MGKMSRCLLMIIVLAAVMLGSTASAAGRPDWQEFYQYFIESGEYSKVLSTPKSEYMGILMERDQQWDCFAVHDMNGDSIPELLIMTEYGGIEQVDVFTWFNDKVGWLGTMGGDNFFQMIICYSDPGYPGLYTVTGGPAMKVDEYTMGERELLHRYVAMTSVDSEGMETVAVSMQVRDDRLYQLLCGSLLSGPDQAQTIVWMRAPELQSDSAWTLFFSALTRPGASGY